MKTPPTGPDKFTIGSTYVFTLIVFFFPIMVCYITMFKSRSYIRKKKEEREVVMGDAVRKLYEKEKHAKQIAYGPHLFFRTVTEAVIGGGGNAEGQEQTNRESSKKE